MYERSFWDSFDGHAGERLATFGPYFLLIVLAFVPIMIATSMILDTEGNKWATFRCRFILMITAFITLLCFNVLFWKSVNLLEYPLLSRFFDSLTLENSHGCDSFLVYLLLPFASLFFFVIASLEFLNSRDIISICEKYNDQFSLKSVIFRLTFLLFFGLLWLLFLQVWAREGLLLVKQSFLLISFLFQVFHLLLLKQIMISRKIGEINRFEYAVFQNRNETKI